MDSTLFRISCNCCNGAVDGIAYRTACRHLYCPSCAKEDFAGGRICRICQSTLTQGEVCEVVTGVSLHYSNIKESERNQLFQKDLDLLHDKVDSLSALIKSLEDAAVHQREEMDVQLHGREREMSELKDAYKEKLRTCQAWKKAYDSIREQIRGSGGNAKAGGNEGALMASEADRPQSAMRPNTQQSMLQEYDGPPPSHPHPLPLRRTLQRTEITTVSSKAGYASSLQQQQPGYGTTVGARLPNRAADSYNAPRVTARATSSLQSALTPPNINAAVPAGTDSRQHLRQQQYPYNYQSPVTSSNSSSGPPYYSAGSTSTAGSGSRSYASSSSVYTAGSPSNNSLSQSTYAPRKRLLPADSSTSSQDSDHVLSGSSGGAGGGGGIIYGQSQRQGRGQGQGVLAGAADHSSGSNGSAGSVYRQQQSSSAISGPGSGAGAHHSHFFDT